jgi:hypothetical protein
MLKLIMINHVFAQYTIYHNNFVCGPDLIGSKMFRKILTISMGQTMQ